MTAGMRGPAGTILSDTRGNAARNVRGNEWNHPRTSPHTPQLSCEHYLRPIPPRHSARARPCRNTRRPRDVVAARGGQTAGWYCATPEAGKDAGGQRRGFWRGMRKAAAQQHGGHAIRQHTPSTP